MRRKCGKSFGKGQIQKSPSEGRCHRRIVAGMLRRPAATQNGPSTSEMDGPFGLGV